MNLPKQKLLITRGCGVDVDQSEDNKTYKFALQPTCEVNTRSLRAIQVIPVFEDSAALLGSANSVQASVGSRKSDYLVTWEKEFIEDVLVFFHERLSDYGGVGKQSFRIGVPLSLSTALSEGYFEWFSDLLNLYRIEPKKLVLHVCERECIGFEEANDALCALNSAGFTVCVDRYLADGPYFEILSSPAIQFFNCDGLVPKKALDSSVARRYLFGLVALAGHLEKKVILNGIDTIKELDFITGLNCVWFQGRMTGGPLAPCELLHYIDSPRSFAPIAD